MTAASSPLVSIIVRTVGREELEQALASIDAQTYPDIETLVVDALGSGLPDLTLTPRQRLLTSGASLDRPAAANAGLDAIRGEFALFLDDDDWIGEDHIQTLVTALGAHPELVAVYSSTQKASKDGELIDEFFAEEFDPAVLRRDNFMPIHSVLFRSSVLAEGCRFDPSLAIYEDWDFWLQLAQQGDFLHVDSVSAFYRQGGDSLTPVARVNEKYAPDNPNAQARARVLGKWAPRWSGEQFNAVLGSLDATETLESMGRSFAQAQAEHLEQIALHEAARKQLAADYEKTLEAERSAREELKTAHESLAGQFSALQTSNARVLRQLDNLRARLDHAEEIGADLSRQLEQIRASFSWRITRPYRFASTMMKKALRRAPAAQSTVESSPRREASEGDASPPALAAQTDATSIRASLDAPTANARFSVGDLTVEGWAFDADPASAGGSVELELSINGRLFRRFTPSMPRADVASSFPRSGGAATCGFRETIDRQFLPRGSLEIALTFGQGDGRVTERRTLAQLDEQDAYSLWLQQRRLDFSAGPEALSARVAVILLPTRGTSGRDAAAADLRAQSYPHISLFELDPASQASAAADAMLSALRDASENFDLLCVLSGDELLHPHAIESLVARSSLDGSELIYADHDTLNAAGQRTEPEFTFGWSPEHLLARNYVGEFFLFSAAAVRRMDCAALAKSLRAVLTLDAHALATVRYRLLLELGAVAQGVSRVPDVLWSRRLDADSEAGHADARHGEALWAQDFVAREAFDSTVVQIAESEPNLRYVDRRIEGSPLISIIIPTMAKMSLIEPCIESLTALTDYSDYEIIILDNSRGRYPEGIEYLRSKGVRIIECDFDFNWPRLNNIGAQAASGDYLLFLNDDIEVTEPRWLGELLKQAQRPEVGAVGALLYYAEKKIQHAGIVLVNYGGGGIHLFHKLAPSPTLFNRLHEFPREVSANTGACLMVSSAKFNSVGGFDEELVVVGNDVDLCLKLRDSGLRNIWTPLSSLIHYESISRKALAPRDDEERLWQRWGDWFARGDEYYNPNLSTVAVDCSRALDLSRIDPGALGEEFARAEDFGAPSGSRQGVNLVGYIRAEMGLGEGARSDARALAAAGIDFGILNFERDNPARMTDLSWLERERHDAPFDVTLWHINADYLGLAMQTIPAHLLERSYHVAYWAWELEVMPEGWRAALELVAEIWVPSEFVRAAIQAETDKPVLCIPHCVAPRAEAAYDRAFFALPESRFLFLAMYDTRSVADRKNPRAALDAYLAAFADDQDSAALVLKVNNATSESMSALLDVIGGRRDIILLEGDHSKAEIDSLIACVDCYVSLHRSEGFGLAPAEAMALGKAVILTNWSGSLEYTHPDHCLPVGFELIELDRDYGPYLKGQRWADPSIVEASAAMQRLVGDRAFAQELGRRAQAFISASFSPEAIGGRMSARLEEIRREAQGKEAPRD